MAHMTLDSTLLAAPLAPDLEKSARPVNISVGGNVSGQLVVGDKNVVIGHVEHGAQVIVIPPDQQPATRPRPTPVLLRPRPFPALLDRVADARTVAGALDMAMPVEVHGPQGIGKTSLLRHLAQRPLETAYPDGVLWFEVRRQPVDDLLQSLYDAFYESDARFKPTPTQIRHALQSKRALIFLDDVELEREELEALMDAAPGCTFALASSRRRLWGEGRSVALRGLPLVDARTLVEQELGRPLTGQEQTAFQVLHAGLEGHPLSLIQAAGLARDGDISLVELARRVKSDSRGKALLLSLLASLSKAEGRVLLAVAALDGAPLHADHVARLTGLSNAGHILESLRERGLVRAHGARRYTLAGVLGVSLQGSADISWWTKRALTYFVEWATGHASDLDDLLADAEAILRVLKWAAEAGRWEQVARLARVMEGALALGKRWGAWAVVLRGLLQAARALGDRALEAYALHQSGTQALALGEVASARTALIRALRLREALGDRAGAAVTRQNLTGITGPPAPPTSGPTSGPPAPPASGLPLVKLGLLCVATGAAMLSSPYFISGWIMAEGPPPAPRPPQVWSAPAPIPLADTPTPIPTWTLMPPPVQTAQPPTPSAYPSPPPPTPVDTPTESATPWPCARPPANWVIYAVRPGDTLNSLALEHETTVELIICYNHLTEPILAGQLIYLPPAPAPTVPLERPDLVVSQLASSSEVHLPGQDIAAQLDLVVANRGAAPASGISVDVVIGRQEDLGSRDYMVIGRGAIHGLAPGESVAVTLPSAVLPQWPAGAYYLGAIVDPVNAWAEIDENNNTAVFPIQLSKPPEPKYPDLVVAEFAGSPHIQPGEVVGDKVYLVARNQGEAEAGVFSVDFYITHDTNLDPGDVRIGRTDVASLAPGQLSNRTYLFGMAIPVDWPAGEAYIAASLDAEKTQTETDETNNVGLFPINVSEPDKPGQPDLYVYKFTGPKSARAGDDIAQQVHLFVSNQGEASAGSFTLNIVIGETVTSAYQDQRVMRSVQVDSVAPGQILEVSLDGVVIPPDWSAGDASYLGVELDVFDQQAEADEGNNADHKPIYVLPWPLPPAAPSGVKYDRSGCAIVYLSWQDNADNEEGFYVYRDSEAIATPPANVESYRDDPAPPGAHRYGVSAYNAAGQSETVTIEVPEDNCYLK